MIEKTVEFDSVSRDEMSQVEAALKERFKRVSGYDFSGTEITGGPRPFANIGFVYGKQHLLRVTPVVEVSGECAVKDGPFKILVKVTLPEDEYANLVSKLERSVPRIAERLTGRFYAGK